MSEDYDYIVRPFEWVFGDDYYYCQGPTQEVVNIYSDEETAIARKKELERWYFIQNIRQMNRYDISEYHEEPSRIPYKSGLSEPDIAAVYDYLVKIFGLNPTLGFNKVGHIRDINLRLIFTLFVRKPAEELLDRFILLWDKPTYKVYKIPKANQRVFFKARVNGYYSSWKNDFYLARNGDFANRLDAIHALNNMRKASNSRDYDIFFLPGGYAELSNLPLLLENFVNQTASLDYIEKTIIVDPSVTTKELLQLNELLIEPFVFFEKSKKEYIENNEKLLPRINTMEDTYDRYWLNLEERVAEYPSIDDYLSSEGYLNKIYTRLRISANDSSRYSNMELPYFKVLETHFFPNLYHNKLIIKKYFYFHYNDWLAPQKTFFSFYGAIRDYEILEVEPMNEEDSFRFINRRVYQVDSLFQLVYTQQPESSDSLPITDSAITVINRDDLVNTSEGQGYTWLEAFEESFENWLIANAGVIKEAIMNVGIKLKEHNE